MNNQLLTMAQAAKYLNMPYATFRYWVSDRRGPDSVPLGIRKFFTKESLDTWKPKDKRYCNYKQQENHCD